MLPLVGGQGGLAHLEFGSSVNPITTRGADYAQRITASPPGFENPAAALYYIRFLYSELIYFLLLNRDELSF